MGVINNVKEYLAGQAKYAASKMSDSVSALSSLSPKQIVQMEEKRSEYLNEVYDRNDEVQETIRHNIGAVGIEVYQAYLDQLKDIYLPIDIIPEGFDEYNRIRFFEITKWVIDSEEKNIDKLVNVYHVLSNDNCNIALIYHRTKLECTITIGIVNTDEEESDPAIADKYFLRVKGAIKGNFPGSEIKDSININDDAYGVGIPKCLMDIASNTKDGNVKSVVSVSNVASEKSKYFISQSMEKLLDGIVPGDEGQDYTVILLAKPVRRQLETKNRLYELYTKLSPYSGWQSNHQYTQSEMDGSIAGVSFNGGISISSPVVSGNFGASFSRSSSTMIQVGKNEGITKSYCNYGVKHTLDVIEAQVKRMEECAALGMWKFASYIISDSPVIANNVAHMYLALTQGDNSYISKASVNYWDGDIDTDEARTILKSVQRLQHPLFGLKTSLKDDWLMYPTLVDATTLISGKELAKALNFPRKSVSGLPVLESASFGREVQRLSEKVGIGNGTDRTIKIGNVYHMRHQEVTEVRLDVDSIASHVFITGSTGTGKSNTIYQLLNALHDQGVHFLVIEPAKGEYKKVFGGKSNVYGTNPSQSELLYINPFSFPKGIHVYEHIDRLVEIINACWPMYAAMPAVLKDAIEKSYERKGWNLKYSRCNPLSFPTFVDVIKELPDVMDSSLYSQDTKSDYAGALITRVRSLTNGLNGQIFCSKNELSDEELFNTDVIVDLSRIGSNETKSLLMGVLVMKLQEYRLYLDKMNEKIIHVTVLEEAHNLLRKTSTAQTQEGANLQGKSVEMITNSIAEMRTYGEGFIIADQAPGLLDEAVIRNTNTKIVLRLPDEADRRIVGKSMALNDEEIVELARLPRGVAAVYQNDWIDTVLCQFSRYDDISPLVYEEKEISSIIEPFLKHVFGIIDNYEIRAEDVDVIQEWISSLRCSELTADILLSALNGDELSEENKRIVAFNIFEGQKMWKILQNETSEEIGIEKVDNRICTYLGVMENSLIEAIRNHILHAINSENENAESSRRYIDYIEARRMM